MEVDYSSSAHTVHLDTAVKKSVSILAGALDLSILVELFLAVILSSRQ